MNKATQLHIVADEAMAQLDLLDPRWCRLKTMPGRAISAGDVAEADALLLRSVTQVDERLLQHSAVRFVGTATIGTDHIDIGLLARKGVGFAYAPGCNANAVVDYVLAAIFAEFSPAELARKRIGIIGCGNVGQRLLACLDHFGLRATVYDPLLQRGVLANNYACDEAGALDAVLNCDIVSLHVPLTVRGEHATHGLLNTARLQRLPRGAMLLNTSRGEVVDNLALIKVAQQRADLRLVLDVYAQEPQPGVALVERANYATPHIAGYSAAGKVRGTYTVIEAMLQYFARHPPAHSSGHAARLPLSIGAPQLDCSPVTALGDLEQLAVQVAHNCPQQQQSQQFKVAYTQASAADRGQVFDRLRRNYRLRSEIDYTPLLKSL